MTHTKATMSLFTRDLEFASAGLSGRRLMGVIQSLGFDTLGASRPLDLALALQQATPDNEILVGHYLAAAAKVPQLVSFAMVAITPAVETVVARSASFISRQSFSEELQITLLEQLHEIESQPVGIRRRWLASTAVASARAATRTSARLSVQTVTTPDGFDVAEESIDDGQLQDLLDAMWNAVGKVITIDEFVVIDCTRVWGVELEWMAQRLGLSYDALRMRRKRAELKARTYILSEVKK
jgi:hypothetical protein